jgi:hypothetical protein
MLKHSKILLAIVFGIIFNSCEERGFLKPEEKEYESGILVFVNPDSFLIDDDQQDSSSRQRQKEKIKQFAKKELRDLNVEVSNIHLEGLPWFFADKVDSRQLRRIKAVKEDPDPEIIEYYPNYSLDLQGRKPMMQGNPILQARKPQMQGDWRYDSAKYASDLVLWLKGSVTTFPPVPSERTVWIMDTGIDTSHQDLNGIVSTNEGYSANGANPNSDPNGHGTMIAGIIGAKAFNQQTGGNPDDIGINGIYPGARMVSVQVLDAQGNSNLNLLLKGVDYIKSKAKAGDVVNISLGRENNSPNCQWGQLGNKLKELAAKGIYVVFSSGNETSPNSENFPSCLADGNFLLSVGSINLFCGYETKTFSSFSNYGQMVGSSGNPRAIWVAPGEQIFSTYPPSLMGTGLDKGVYGLASGTSFSAAMMSGIIYTLGASPVASDSVLRGGEGIKYPIAKF